MTGVSIICEQLQTFLVRQKTALFWNEQVKKSIRKRCPYRKEQKRRDSKSRELRIVNYNILAVAKEMEGKKIVDQLKQNKSEALFRMVCLGWFRKARQSKNNNKDIIGMSYTRGKDGNIKVGLEDKIEEWKKYKEKLLNEENNRSGELNVEKNEGLR